MPTNINFDKKLGITGVTGISLPSSSTPSYQNEYSFQFDGVDDYIDCGDNDNLSFGDATTDSPFSISAWVKMTDATKFRIAFKSDNSATNNEYGLFTSGADQLFFQLYDETTSIKITKSYTTALTSYEGQWIHIVGTYNGNSNTSGIKLYLNGIRVDNSGSSLGSYTAMHNTNASFEIGKYLTSSANGLIDEVSIFNSELSSSDITTIYNSGVPNNLNDLSTPPLSWWRMGEAATFDGIRDWDLVDQGTGGNDAVSQNIADSERVTDVPPNPFANTKSILLDGIDDYVDCGNPASLQITGALTLSAWIKTTDNSTYEIIIGKDSINAGTRSYMLYKIGSKARFLIFNSSSFEYVQSNINVTDGNWHHIMGVNDGVDLKIYIDGNLDVTNVGGGGTILNGTSPFEIGRRASSPSNRAYFTGNIDEVAVWDTDQSANASAIGGTIPTDLSTYNPISWWRCGDSDTSPILSDNGSGGNDGTMTNFTTFSTDVPT